MPPVDLEPGIDNDLLKQKPLGTAITLAERMNDVQVTVIFSNRFYQSITLKPLQPVSICQGVEGLVGLRFDSGNITKTRITFGDINRSDLSGPIIQIPKRWRCNRFKQVKS